MRVKNKYSSSRSSSGRVTIKVFKETKELFESLEKALQNEFEKWAEDSGVKVRRGTRYGNTPTLANAADLVARQWKALPESTRSKHIKQCVSEYIRHVGE